MLKDFRLKRTHMAIVIDEFGAVSGLVTIEDILELIVGDIEDEYDEEEKVNIRKLQEHIFSIKALTEIKEFNDFFKTHFSNEEVDTIGGLVMKAFGHLPSRGENININGYNFKISSADSRKIIQIHRNIMEQEYCPKNIEIYVQKYWKNKKTFHVYEDETKEKYYCLPMLPYPSGKLHMVNWCPSDKTVLANEQVINGCCWRCQSTVITKTIPQWFIKIRNYAEPLYNDLKKLKNWPEKVKNMQKNWIGRSEGFEISFDIYNSSKKIKIFTTRIDTLMGVTYLAISPFHKFSIYLSKKNQILKKFIETQNNENFSKEEIEAKKFYGINTNIFAIHPIIKKKIPIWIANYVINDYGTGSIMCVPGHNENDWNFAIKNHLKIKYVIQQSNIKNIQLNQNTFFPEKGILINSGEFNQLDYNNAIKKIKKKLSEEKKIKTKIIYKLKDWCISRQRYWGTPIPMATMKNGKIVPIPEKDLPVLLPEKIKNSDLLKNYSNTKSTYYTTKINNQTAVRETDTFDTFMESSWY
ncbi:putative leucine--tRNA ligase, mitochondrial, partial [Aphis craccivora]